MDDVAAINERRDTSEEVIAMIPPAPEPDQQSSRWDDHVLVYEQVFEPFSMTFAEIAIERLQVGSSARVLDVGAGSGGVGGVGEGR